MCCHNVVNMLLQIWDALPVEDVYKRQFLCGPLYLKSYVNLHLEPNSRLLANPDESIYTQSAFRENRGEGMMWILSLINIFNIYFIKQIQFQRFPTSGNQDIETHISYSMHRMRCV